MTKGIRLLILFVLVSIIVAYSCTSVIMDDKKESEKVFKEYINLLYTVKPKSKSNRNMTLQQVHTENIFQDVMTENAYNSLWKDQIPLVLSLIVNRNNYDIKVNNIDIENYHKNKDGTTTYTYNVHLNIFSPLDKRHREERLRGRATLKKIKFKWKIVKDKQFNLEKILLK
ncbi:hypothetical protein FDB72_14900 [Clostridium botulinum]|uniref:hypothetical protein n=1 Tax=Clostridium botulinum TaxID=1491 RepID=UPI0001F85063|nr:hypothetical protein [Clostridium botulinum]KEI91683.1 hypothetical protein N491_07185 [Clostridium botulinum B2 275]KEI99305.1 hypothetical protein N496_06915 [Clostridium botulinum A2B3 87]MCJ8171829.1 hypothetical protein [Clostridium botulinum]MCS4470060.1 hypothetical protein [Clostridium botulinum]MCS4474141.1 hypothetical protein [Clostridium botulinum]